MTTTRTVHQPDQWAGWNPAHTVETERVTALPDTSTTFNGAYRVYLNGQPVGYVASQQQGRGYWWGYTLDSEPQQQRMIYTARQRRQALNNLVERALRNAR